MAVEHLNPAEDHRRTNQEDDRHNNDEDGERVRQVFTGRSSREGPKAPRRRTRQAGPNSVNAVAGGPAGGYALHGDRTVWAWGSGYSGHPTHRRGEGRCRPRAQALLTISTEISTAATVPLFSSQWVVFLSSGQPTPGP